MLVDYDRAARIGHLAGALGPAPATVNDAPFGSGLEDRFDAGLIDGQEYRMALGRALDRDVGIDLWTAAREASMRLDPALPDLVARVAARCDVAILTKNGGLLADVLPRLVPGLFPLFEARVLCSGRLGARKPQARIHHAALEQLGHRPDATLFLDDAQANVDGARAAGLQATLASPSTLHDVLRRYGVA